MVDQIKDFHMPFEGDKHQATIVMLPYRDDTWAENGKVAFEEYFEVIKAISNHEKVYVIVDEHVKYDITRLNNINNIEIVHINYNDSWARDTSPIFLKKGKQLIGVDFRFNAWGGSFDGLYDDYKEDDAFSKRFCKYINKPCLSLDEFILEGGSIHTNGNDVLLTTKACLLSEGRNPNLTQKEIENNLKQYLNMKKIVWIDNGIVNDETDEHVDNMACFYDENTVLLAWPSDENDIQYQNSKKAYDSLIKEGFKVIKVMLPKPIYLSNEQSSRLNKNSTSKDRKENDRLALSYVNFYQGEDFVILPKFGVETDELALKQFESLYPNKKVYQIKSLEILTGGGNIHCITMQIPAED